MIIVLKEIYNAPATKRVRQAVTAFRRQFPSVGRGVLRAHRSRSERELAELYDVADYPAFVFADEKGEVLAEVEGTSLKALKEAYFNLTGADAPARPKQATAPRRHSRFVIARAGLVDQNRRVITIEGLPVAFCPHPSALKKVGCISWQRDRRGVVTATFETIKAAESTFNGMLDKGALGVEKALPEDVLWTSERLRQS